MVVELPATAAGSIGLEDLSSTGVVHFVVLTIGYLYEQTFRLSNSGLSACAQMARGEQSEKYVTLLLYLT